MLTLNLWGGVLKDTEGSHTFKYRPVMMFELLTSSIPGMSSSSSTDWIQMSAWLGPSWPKAASLILHSTNCQRPPKINFVFFFYLCCSSAPSNNDSYNRQSFRPRWPLSYHRTSLEKPQHRWSNFNKKQRLKRPRRPVKIGQPEH